MSQARRQTGQQGEAVAASHLREQGYRIIDRNYRCPFGEIDLIGQEGETLVFIEVKCRRSDAFGPPELAVGPQKQKKLSLCALHYLSQTDQQSPARFDVVAIRLRPDGHRVELIRNAFELRLPG